MMYSCLLGTFPLKTEEMREMLNCYFAKKQFDPLPLLNDWVAEREKLIYEGLIKIPFGKTICYSDFAKMIGLRGVRNIASIIAKNPFPIIVPCHRVVKKNGDIGDYSFLEGRKTKKLLLDYEQLY